MFTRKSDVGVQLVNITEGLEDGDALILNPRKALGEDAVEETGPGDGKRGPKGSGGPPGAGASKGERPAAPGGAPKQP